MLDAVNRSIALPLWGAAIALFIVAALVVIIWSLKRHSRVHLRNSFGDPESLPATIAGLTQMTILDGNGIELLENGEFFERLWADLEGAKKTINLETFLSKEGEATHRLTDILVRKSREGVKVRVMLDANGGKNYGKESLKQLSDAGVCVCTFHPFNLKNIGRYNNRTHRKIVVIDGCTGYVGGHCMVDSWLGQAQDRKHFRDITARVEGPVVHQLQAAFAENWIEESGDAFGGENFFPALEPRGDCRAHAVFVSPAGLPSTLKMLHYIAIRAAQRSITVQNPYFLPDPDARDALVAAVKRGVNVRVMIPALDATDSKIVQHACHHHYGTLLKGGVKIFEYQKTLLHQKVFTVDGEWSSVGSTNFDDRSFEINDEISLAIYDKGIARKLEQIFEADLRESVPVSLEKWLNRTIIHKLKDACAFALNEQL